MPNGACRLKREHDLGLFAVDYLRPMPAQSSNENGTTENSRISQSLKNLVRELNIPVVATVHVPVGGPVQALHVGERGGADRPGGRTRPEGTTAARNTVGHPGRRPPPRNPCLWLSS